jgi:hypothetical protein
VEGVSPSRVYCRLFLGGCLVISRILDYLIIGISLLLELSDARLSLLLLMLLLEFSDGRKTTLIQLSSKTTEVLPPLRHWLLRLFGLWPG